MKPKLSVIVPIYNTQKYLKECLDSIIGQKYKNFELILVDDQSTDGSEKICDEYARKYDKVTVIHKKNTGLLHTRKAGFNAAQGEYISFIDSDDYILPDMYEYMMNKIEEYCVDIISCNMTLKYESYEIPLKTYIKNGYYDKERLKKEIYPFMVFSFRKDRTSVIPSLCNKIIKKDILGKAFADADVNISYGEDALCTYPSFLDAESVYFAEDKFFYVYRQVFSSITNNYDNNMLEKCKLLIDLLDKSFKKRGIDGKEQISYYAARYSVESIRKELLFDKSNSLHKRIAGIKEYVSYNRISEALDISLKGEFDKSAKIKFWLIRKKWLYLLYFLFLLKYKILSLKGITKYD